MGLDTQDDPPLPDPVAPAGVDAASWRQFQHRVQQRRFQSLAERARDKSEAARRELEALQLTLDEARQLRPAAAQLRELEEVARAATGSFRPRGRSRVRWIVAMLALFVVMGAAVAAAWSFSRAASSTPSSPGGTGSLRVESDPPGAAVSIDGASHGITPLSTQLGAGRHEILIEAGGRTQRSALTVRAGGELVHVVQFAGTAAAATPPIMPIRPPAEEIQAPIDPAAPTGGWVTVTAPFPLSVRDRSGRLLGSSTSGRILLPAGDQLVEVANPDLGYTSRHTVRVQDGTTTRLQVAAPSAALSVNAIPWAEVAIDGRVLGETPLGDLTETVGDHQLEFRHPQLGIKRVTVRVTLKEPARVSVDMRTP